MNENNDRQGHLIDLSWFKMEPHVKDALDMACSLSQGQPLCAGDFLNAALIISTQASSSAFSTWAAYFPPDWEDHVPKPKSEFRIDPTSVPLNEFTAKSYEIARPFFEKGRVIWGRDFISIALLAMGDPSLDDIATATRSSIGLLRDAWFLFVTSSDIHGDLTFWTQWWEKARVHPPDTTMADETSGTYLLTWDPGRFANDRLIQAFKESEQGHPVVLRWNVGKHGLSRGNRVFFMRHGENRPGIIGAGYVISDVKEGPHWDESKPTNWTSYYAEVSWDVLRELPVISHEELIRETGEENLWTIFDSGLPIPKETAKRLEAIWREALELQDQTTYGPTTRIATDIWTLNDALGYQDYAYAIYRFMTHPQTEPPLTISIQAPWGGGKTSLMRMVQKLLDPKALENKSAGPKEQGSEFTVKEALREIDDYTLSGEKKDPPTIDRKDTRKLLTVWFNAWKYEGANQVWAGLADAIMKQVTARLSIVERERFWLRLSLRRVDADKIRHSIHERIINGFWRGARAWLWGSGFLFLVSTTLTVLDGLQKQVIPWLSEIGWFGMGTSVLAAFLSSVISYFSSKKKVNKAPASITLSKYTAIPDYNKELGFVHHVEADLHRVFATVPEKNRPIVIFIDDLDRCSPAKVAQVLEAVNLFLAGEFPNCIFLLGMDSEMVAAALQAAHKDMLACLPSDASIPLGWRFMDKFVQLPFLIPPAEREDIDTYTESLFIFDENNVEDATIQEMIDQAEKIEPGSDNEEKMAELFSKNNVDERTQSIVKKKVEAKQKQQILNKGFDLFTDNNPEIRRVISSAVDYFCGNPRELKRFVNGFRFQHFIWWVRKYRGLDSPSRDQLLRWTVLCTKWPEAVRWIRRAGGSDYGKQAGGDGEKDVCDAPASGRIRILEEISGNAENLTSWQNQALERLGLTPEDAPWLAEPELLRFFHHEYNGNKNGERLSDGEGKGLW